MGHAAPPTKMTVVEFLEWDKTQTERREFVAGEVFAMAGAEDRHVTACLNLAMALRQHLAGTPCKTYMSDMKLAVATADTVFYPDVMVTCSAADHASKLVKREPVLVIEVLSPRTAAYDQGEKFARYRQLPSLQEYVVVDLDSRRTSVYRKGADGLWVLHPFEPADTVRFASVELDVPAVKLYAEIDLPGEA